MNVAFAVDAECTLSGPEKASSGLDGIAEFGSIPGPVWGKPLLVKAVLRVPRKEGKNSSLCVFLPFQIRPVSPIILGFS